MVKKVCELVMSRVMSSRHKKVNAHAQVEVMMHKVEDYEQKHHPSPEEEHHCSKPTLEVPENNSLHTESEPDEERIKDALKEQVLHSEAPKQVDAEPSD